MGLGRKDRFLPKKVDAVDSKEGVTANEMSARGAEPLWGV